jgi:hypothetical protein
MRFLSKICQTVFYGEKSVKPGSEQLKQWELSLSLIYHYSYTINDKLQTLFLLLGYCIELNLKRMCIQNKTKNIFCIL